MTETRKRPGKNARWWSLRLAAALGAIVFLFGGGGALLVWFLNYFPDPVMKTKVTCRGNPAVLAPGRRFKLLNWNIQYGAGRNYHFFYDGGDAVHVKRQDVTRTMDEVARVLRKASPQFVLLQEVDRDSARTHRIDQMKRLTALGHWKCWATTPYHRSRYVPVPMKTPLGRVDMHLATLSQFKTSTAVRRALPLLQENFVRRAFNLKRAILEVSVPVEGRSRPLVLLNVHLSAFSFGDGTLDRQTDAILKRLDELDRKAVPWILAGDFNMVPPGTDPSQFGKESRYYADRRNPINRIYKKHRPALPLAGYRKDPDRYFTYLPFRAVHPDRMIDYVFVSKDIEVHTLQVIQQKVPCSDHLPLVLEASVK